MHTMFSCCPALHELYKLANYLSSFVSLSAYGIRTTFLTPRRDFIERLSCSLTVIFPQFLFAFLSVYETRTTKSFPCSAISAHPCDLTANLKLHYLDRCPAVVSLHSESSSSHPICLDIQACRVWPALFLYIPARPVLTKRAIHHVDRRLSRAQCLFSELILLHLGSTVSSVQKELGAAAASLYWSFSFCPGWWNLLEGVFSFPCWAGCLLSVLLVLDTGL